MAQLLVRDIPAAVVDALKRRAASHGRSAEAEHRAILEDALKVERDAFRQEARRMREQLAGRKFTDSADLIRQLRDAR